MVLETVHGLDDLRRLGVDELTALAVETRQLLVETLAQTGGHLSVNLGTVELTIAVYRAFDSPRDVVVWDIGHQCYTQKLFTGRRDRFATLRQAGGLSGFTAPDESEHDWIANTHCSTALSYAQGIARAVALGGEHRHVVAVVGDGGLTGGMALEALGAIGYHGTSVIVILNDNGRSYAPSVTRLSLRVDELAGSRDYVHATQRLARAVAALDEPSPVLRAAACAVNDGDPSTPSAYFETLGYRYLGPVDGHDVPALEAVLDEAKAFDGPVVVHALTEKGRGYAPCRDDADKRLHDVGPFDVATGPQPPQPGSAPSYTELFGQALVDAAEADDRIDAVVAAMGGPTGLLPFQRRWPERFFDAGIAEQHAVGVACGLAIGGRRPVCAIFSTFLMRAFDQVNLDAGLLALPVVFCVDRAGITGSDGPSHHGVLDLALMSKVPGLVVFAPSSGAELVAMLRHALTLGGPSVIRYPKGAAVTIDGETGSGLMGRRLLHGTEVCVIAAGRLLAPALDAAEALGSAGISTTVWDPRVVVPIDRAMIVDAHRHALVVTVEDGIRIGGLSAEVGYALARDGANTAPPRTLALGTPRQWLPQGKPDRILRDLGLDAHGIAAAILKAMRSATASPTGEHAQLGGT
jgi:1-deoxy-D-xylulose-5-phosphate synthase